MALKSDMPEESRNSKVIKRGDYSIIFPDDLKELPSLNRDADSTNKKDTDEKKAPISFGRFLLYLGVHLQSSGASQNGE